MNKISIMQGRLSLPLPDRIQGFPWATWPAEFENARIAGYDGIEWLFEADRYTENPIWSSSGRTGIMELAKRNGVSVSTLCASYFMVYPFHGVDDGSREEGIKVLVKLIGYASEIGVSTILFPVLEQSAVKSEHEKDILIESLAEPLKIASDFGIRVGLETELPAQEYLDLVVRHPLLGVYFDTGNATAKGYRAADDILTLKSRIYGIHIKDRVVGGSSTFLGQGDCDFRAFFASLFTTGYQGPVTLESAFNASYIDVARRHLEYIRRLIKKAEDRK
jgi:sugar phosphate isomerase/epimerase